jgi:gamma-glutamyltranspeptidase/glutathione hydrolase
MNGMIAAPQPIAVEEGIKVLRKGGNAMDAAVTAAFVQGVVDPQMCGIGGFGTMQVHMAKSGEQKMIDFHAKAPHLASPDMWKDLIIGMAKDGFGYILKGSINDVGYQSVAVPGTVMGLYEGLTHYGTMNWKEIIQPAIRYAQEGFRVTLGLRNWWLSKTDSGRIDFGKRIQATPASARIYTRGPDVFYEEGDLLVSEEMARSLERLANEGPEVFYKGDIAQIMSQDMQKNGGLLRKKDLQDYQVTLAEPLRTTYRGYTLSTNPPPGGGITLIQILNILEGYDLDKLGHNSARYIDLVSKVMRIAFADRDQLVGDPSFVKVPVEKLISKEYADECRKKIQSMKTNSSSPKPTFDSPHTTHISVLDKDGNAVALTHSLGMSSGVVTPGLGFTYNNAMIAFDPIPGGVNAIAPGKSRVSGMCPTFVLKGREPFLILGALGGARIITGVLQVILNVLDHKMSLIEAIVSPRFDCQRGPITLEARIPYYVCEELEKMGNPVERTVKSYGNVARIHGIWVDKAHGILQGGADPAGDGVAMMA